ncbi:MAG: multidrug DMT transporter permease [Planctomycetes bacterium GWF2_41_51]|nr:MAG: multidrug DMT transporter permease [Planctomycetes bacterium GWF2_41_51]HBG25570.1 multidrug DMT transporter permease [Phycisphaerales bacterium]
MVIIESYSLAVLLCFVVMLAWGSWPNTMKLVPKEWRFQLFYWDYAVGVLIFSLVMAFTLGSNGSTGRGFLADISQASSKALWLAFIGGVIFNCYNILLVSGVDIAGIAVAFPIGVGLALVLGTIVNYIANPMGNAAILFIGIAAVVLAVLFCALAYKKVPSVGEKSTTKGILVSLAAGVFGTFWYYLIAASMAAMSADRVLEAGKLGPYSAVVMFAVGLVASNFVLNSLVMKKPFAGSPVPFSDYFAKGNLKIHLIGILGGLIWGVGISFSILASGAAGFAISYGLAQACTMVAAIWGVFIWKEFKSASKGAGTLITAMFISYFVGIALLIVSRSY